MARRMRGEGSIWQRQSDGLWIGAIDMGYGLDGQRRRKRVSAKTQAGVLKKLNEAKKAREKGDLTTSRMRLDKWLRRWVTEIAPTKKNGQPNKPDTIADYESKIEQYIIPTIGTKRLPLTAADVRLMHQKLRARGDLSESTIHHAHRVLCNALNAAMREIGLGYNAAEVVPAPAMAPAETGALTVDQAKKALRLAADDRNASRWLFALLTGARQGECLGLRWDFVDLDAPIPFAELSWQLKRVRYRHGCLKDGEPTCDRRPASCPRKELDVAPGLEVVRLDPQQNLCLLRPKTTSSVRLVPLAPPLAAALRLHREQDRTPNPHGLVWHRANGAPIPALHDWASWKALLERVGGADGVTLHEARHTTVTLLSDMNVDKRVIADVVGHSDVLTQAGYRHGNLALPAAALGDLGALLELD